MTFSLYHAVDPAFWLALLLEAEQIEEQATSISDKTHTHVAYVTVPDIENVCTETSNFFEDWDWTKNEGVKLTEGTTGRLRSTSVGDLIGDEQERYFIVTRHGLRRLYAR